MIGMIKKIFLPIGLLIALIFTVFLIKWAFVEFYYPDPTVMQTYISPDGKYTAYVFESNSGATSGWVYHVSIVRTEKRLGKGPGNIYTSGVEPIALEWLDNRTLYIEDYDSVRTTQRKEKIYDVVVKFKSLE